MDNKLMQEAINEANKNELNNFKDGGPFGAIIEKDGKIIAKAHNTVLADNDPTAHAEIKAIRNAAKTLGTHDLTGCILYTSSEPCPMCLSAIIWANIKTVYFANTKEDAANIGFRDDLIYEFIKADNKNKEILNAIHLDNTDAIKTFEHFDNNTKKELY